MIILAALAAIVLLAAALFAISKGDTFVIAGIIVVLVLVVLVVAPQVPALMHQVQQAIDGRLPVALR